VGAWARLGDVKALITLADNPASRHVIEQVLADHAAGR
jgi:hypothetical protein